MVEWTELISTGMTLSFAAAVRDRENRVPVRPGPRHWEIVRSLCEDAGVRGNLVPDAWLAALAIESGSEWITTDRDFTRFRERSPPDQQHIHCFSCKSVPDAYPSNFRSPASPAKV